MAFLIADVIGPGELLIRGLKGIFGLILAVSLIVVVALIVLIKRNKKKKEKEAMLPAEVADSAEMNDIKNDQNR